MDPDEPKLSGLSRGDPKLSARGVVKLPPARPDRYVPLEEETFDIDRLRIELVDPDEVGLQLASSILCTCSSLLKKTSGMMLLYTLLGLGFVALTTLAAIGGLVWRRRLQMARVPLLHFPFPLQSRTELGVVL